MVPDAMRSAIVQAADHHGTASWAYHSAVVDAVADVERQIAEAAL